MSVEHNDLQNVLQRWWSLSLRAKGVAVLAPPLAALFAVLVAIQLVDGEVQQIDLRIGRASSARVQLMRSRASVRGAEEQRRLDGLDEYEQKVAATAVYQR